MAVKIASLDVLAPFCREGEPLELNDVCVINVAAGAAPPSSPASDVCIGFSFHLSENTAPAAWEYT